MRAHIRNLAAGLVLGLALTGCTSTLNQGQLETEIATQLDERFVGANWNVSCPADVKPEAGGTFDCTATSGDGERFTIEVTQEDADGAVSWRIVE